MSSGPGGFRLSSWSPSSTLSILSWGGSLLSPLPWRHSLSSLDAFVMMDISSGSPLPLPGPSSPAEHLRGGASSGGPLFWSPDFQDEPSDPSPSSQPSPLPAPTGGSKSMAVDFPPEIRNESVYAISLKVTEDGLGDDLSAAV